MDGGSVFLGGRQRADGHQGAARIWMDDDGWLQVVDDYEQNLSLVVNTPARRDAWELLPDPPKTFGYRDAEKAAKPVMRSASTFNHWFRECRRLGVVVEGADGKLMKATGKRKVESTEAGEVA